MKRVLVAAVVISAAAALAVALVSTSAPPGRRGGAASPQLLIEKLEFTSQAAIQGDLVKPEPVTLRNVGAAPLQILGIRPGCSCVADGTTSHLQLNPAAQKQSTLRWTPRESPDPSGCPF